MTVHFDRGSAPGAASVATFAASVASCHCPIVGRRFPVLLPVISQSWILRMDSEGDDMAAGQPIDNRVLAGLGAGSGGFTSATQAQHVMDVARELHAM
eukprot:3167858-Pyramimonas_sp.AAC.1